MARAVQKTQCVEVTMRLRLETGAGRSKNALTRVTNPTHVGSIVMMTFIRPERNKKPGRIGMTSNTGLEVASLAARASR